MKHTNKAMPFLVALAAAFALLSVSTANAMQDSGDSPLYQATLRQAYTGMNEVRTVAQPEKGSQRVALGAQPTQEPIETRCPVIPTECPAEPEYTKCNVTHEPNAPTECRYQATLCNAKTWCPQEPTFCPEQETWCPAEDTKCPEVNTKCPVKDTECPAEPEYTKCNVTHEPNAPTECRYVATLCEAKTWCPQEVTVCPEKTTECPEKETYCPKKVSKCNANATVCHKSPTKCPPKKTNCPPKKTKCPEEPKYTRCGVTHKPNAPTECRYVATL